MTRIITLEYEIVIDTMLFDNELLVKVNQVTPSTESIFDSISVEMNKQATVTKSLKVRMKR